MIDLRSHYQLLLGLDSSWQVDDVQLSVENNKVEIAVSYASSNYLCPKCGAVSKLHDHAQERYWRHLDTMQFETQIRARIPRCSCNNCGVKTIDVPWTAGKHVRFTLLFEAFAIDVLQHCSSVTDACHLLRIDWHTADQIMKRAVQRGLSRRDSEAVPYIGIDEKSYLRHHNYVSVMSDLLEGRVLDVVENRTKESTEELINTLSTTQKEGVEAVAMDFWQGFISATENLLPEAVIVHDKFHISKYLNEAVDTVRKQENKELLKANNKTLIGSKYYWLQNVENMKSSRLKQFHNLLRSNLKTGVAWSLKNLFHEFWTFTDICSAREFFNAWVMSVNDTKLKPLQKVAMLLSRHLDKILTYFIYPISNGVAEGLNSKIQIVKAAARGFRSFQSYRTRILFFCGKLCMKPRFSH